MTSWLAFDWDSRRLYVVAASLRGRQVTSTAARAIPFDADLNPDEPDQVGGFLRRQIEQLGLDVSAAVACVERSDAVLHQIVLPPVPANELAKMVELQCAGDLLPVEPQFTYDYVHASGVDGSIRAMVAAVAIDRLERICGVAQAAGLNLRSVRFQPLARITARQVWGTVPAAAPATAGEILLAAGEHHIEAIATLHGQLLGSQLVPIPEEKPNVPELGRAAVARLAAALGAQAPGVATGAIVAGTATAASWAGSLAGDLGKSLVTYDPFPNLPDVPVDAWDTLAALAGALAQEAPGDRAAIDFLNPHRPAAPHPLWKHRWIAAAAAAAAVSLAFAWHLRARFRDLDAEFDRWQTEQRTARAELKKLAVHVDQHAAVADWLDRRVAWLDEYGRLLRLLPDASELHLTHVSFALGSSRGGRGTIHLQGYAASDATVANVAMRLAGSGRYQVRPRGIVPAGRNAGYPWRFEADLAIVAPAHDRADRGTELAMRKE